MTTTVNKKTVTRLGLIALAILTVPLVLASCGKTNKDDGKESVIPASSEVFPASYRDGTDGSPYSIVNIHIDQDNSLKSSRVLPINLLPMGSNSVNLSVMNGNAVSTALTAALEGDVVTFTRISADVTATSPAETLTLSVTAGANTETLPLKLVDDAQWVTFDKVTVNAIGAGGVGTVGDVVSVATEADLSGATVSDVPIVTAPVAENKFRVFYDQGTASINPSNPDIYVTNSNPAFFNTKLVFAGGEGVGKGWYFIVLPKANSADKTATFTVKTVEGNLVAMFKVKSVQSDGIDSADLPSSYVTGTPELSVRLDSTNTTTPVFSDIDVRVPTATGKSSRTLPVSFFPEGTNIDQLELTLYNNSTTGTMPTNIVAEYDKATGLISFDFKDATPATDLDSYYTLKLTLAENKFLRVGIQPVLDSSWKAVTSLDLVQAKDRKRSTAEGGGLTDAPAVSKATAADFAAGDEIMVNYYAAGDKGVQSPTTTNGDLKNEPGEVDVTNKFLVRFNNKDVENRAESNNPDVKVVISGTDASSFTYDLFQIGDHSYWLNIAASGANKEATVTVTSLEDSTKVAVLKIKSQQYSSGSSTTAVTVAPVSPIIYSKSGISTSGSISIGFTVNNAPSGAKLKIATKSGGTDYFTFATDDSNGRAISSNSVVFPLKPKATTATGNSASLTATLVDSSTNYC